MSQRNPTDQEATILASEYIQHGDQTRAFRAAFPNSEATEKSVNEIASRCFELLKVRSRIDQLQEISKTQSEKEFTMSVSELKKVLATVIQKTIKAEGNLSAAVAAVREFNAMDGNHSAVKSDITLKEKDPEKRKSRIKELLSKTQS